MKRALIIAVIALSSTLPLQAGAGPITAPASDATPESVGCTSSDGSLLAIGKGCCQRRGGLCKCQGTSATCCDGSAGVGCSCRSDSPMREDTPSDVPS